MQYQPWPCYTALLRVTSRLLCFTWSELNLKVVHLYCNITETSKRNRLVQLYKFSNLATGVLVPCPYIVHYKNFQEGAATPSALPKVYRACTVRRTEDWGSLSKSAIAFRSPSWFLTFLLYPTWLPSPLFIVLHILVTLHHVRSPSTNNETQANS